MARKRPSWHEYFMLVAKIVSTRSTCNSRPTGAVIVKDNHILATGYNGAMPGAPHCIDMPDVNGTPFCYRRSLGVPDIDKYNFCKASHAEANAIAQAARYGISIAGATLYTTLAPCYVCLKLIATARIRAIYYEHQYESATPERDRFWKEAIQEAGIQVFEQLIISAETYDYILSDIRNITSRRRSAPTDFYVPGTESS
ncbi:dCMP deaminase [Desulfacinum hydrothermale DSM 13146]|uniref:dCMP deaminase n=1 Tax=Desulfacinum hydrothermale DSM 13146 TaxID=1121390 RepID=A0A1W1XFW0_9BACT|nr:deaminase [Desulfacinum hydrothermale]SMC22830.1 dCMP deaminase [Desulfacinum hydrothermale DSM 13146]